MSNDDLLDELANIRIHRKKIKRRSYSRSSSKLDRYRHEILFLFQEDASLEDIRLWLKSRKCKVDRSTIHRRIHLWMEGLR